MTKRFREPATGRTRTSGHRGLPSMTERQLEAYLASRDAIRRIQRTSELFSEVAAANLPVRLQQRSIQ